jgi:hypothetical protein
MTREALVEYSIAATEICRVVAAREAARASGDTETYCRVNNAIIRDSIAALDAREDDSPTALAMRVAYGW